MERWLCVGGSSAAFMGVGMAVPCAAAYAESRPTTGVSLSLLLIAGVLTVSGLGTLIVGHRQRRGPSLPSGVRVAIIADVFFLAFCALEQSDGFVRQEGRVFYWTTILFLPALILLYGLVSARHWAWWTARALAAVACLLFLVLVAFIPFGDIRDKEGPAPWYGRVYMVCVSLVFAGTAACVHRSLGSRMHFPVAQPRAAIDRVRSC